MTEIKTMALICYVLAIISLACWLMAEFLEAR